jgi:hypothetical protein
MIPKDDMPQDAREVKPGMTLHIKVKKVHPDHIEMDPDTIEHHLDEGDTEEKSPRTENKPKVRKSKDGSFGSLDLDNMRSALQKTEDAGEPEGY